jgi:CheY-like chemotaxis protein
MARILIIEESMNAAEVAHVICQDDGHSCEAVSTLEDASERLAGGHFDLVLLEHNQLGRSEREFLAALRRNEATQELPVIVLTELSDFERKNLESSGVNRVIGKPYSIQSLQVTLRQLLKRQASRSQG